MACFSPLTLYKSKSGPDKKTGRWPLVPFKEGYVDRPVEVPCGYCVGCRLERARQWSLRLAHESLYHADAYFLTFTYDDSNLCYGNEVPTLVPKHLELFWKRLRKELNRRPSKRKPKLADYSDKKRLLKYFACGEYGDNTYRPHYHAIVFGFHLSDLVVWKYDGLSTTYTSATLDALWTMGRVVIGPVTQESSAYVARYTIKKQYGVRHDSYYGELGIEPEFVRMSKGIGKQFFIDYQNDIYVNDVMIYTDGVGKGRPPKYYDRLKAELDPDSMKLIVKEREKNARLPSPDRTRERLEVREKIKKNHMKRLKRGSI